MVLLAQTTPVPVTGANAFTAILIEDSAVCPQASETVTV
jgi:hypothetical protein